MNKARQRHPREHTWRNAPVIFEVARATFLRNVFDAYIVFVVLVQPLIIALIAIWMLRGGDEGDTIFAVVGSGMSGLWSSLLFITGGSLSWERSRGTLEMIVGSPSPLWVIVTGKIFAQVAQSAVSMFVAYVAASIVFRQPLTIALPGWFGASLLATLLGFVSFGLVIAPFFLLNPAIQVWNNGLEFPVYILAGFLFPVALLPKWTNPLSWMLAPYWAARALHGAAQGKDMSHILFSIMMLFLVSILHIYISRFLFRKVLKKARVDATLGYQ